MPAHHPTLPGSHKWAHNAPKGSRTAGQCHHLTKGGVEVMMWHCDICDVPMGHTHGLPIPMATGMGFMRVWVRVGPELPMGYPCYALLVHKCNTHRLTLVASCLFHCLKMIITKRSSTI